MTAAGALGWRREAVSSLAGLHDNGLRDGRPGAVLWSAAVLFVLAGHALIAWTLLASADMRPDLQQPLPAIMMDLAPPVAPQPVAPQTRSAPPPMAQPVPHPPAPQPKLTAPELPQVPAEAALPPPPKKQAKQQAKPQPQVKPQPVKTYPAKALPPKPDTTPMPRSALQTPPASAPAVPAPAQNAAQQVQASAAAAVAAKSNWLGDVVQHIAKFKRTPRSRLRMPLRAVIGFEINRDGKLLSQHLLQSSGRDDIDEEALAWIRRADPLPKPPQEISDGDLSHGFTIPVDFMPR
ncbi:MAG TPA: TonB family protein [Terriglobia bacterium]|nr:TonB family protein [Terriglobia bacterium]